MQVLENAADVQLLQLVVQDSHDDAEDEERGKRSEPTQAASVVAHRNCCGCRLTSQDFNA
jgi:hypothetical protein